MASIIDIQIAPLDPIRIPLIKKLYKAHYPAAKPKRDELIITANVLGNIAAVVRFRTQTPYRLLTGMLVTPDYRGFGVGHKLLEYCCQHILQAHDYCFAYRYLESYYAQHGFQHIDPSELPQTLQQNFNRYVDHGRDLIPMRFVAQNQ